MKNRSWWKQAWTITKIEMRRAFFSKRAFWVYGLALFPSIIFLGYSLSVKFEAMRLSSAGLAKPALLDGIRTGESDADIIQRLGKAPRDVQWSTARRLRKEGESSGVTTHAITPVYDARFVRLNIMQSTYTNERMARIYEVEVYGNGSENLALNKPATSSQPCSADEGPEKALNGSVSKGTRDRWCSRGWPSFIQVDLGAVYPIQRIVIKHASAGGEQEELNTSVFNIQAGINNTTFATIVNATGARQSTPYLF
jgi:hypothetical protein